MSTRPDVLRKEGCPVCGRAVLVRRSTAYDPVEGFFLTNHPIHDDFEERRVYIPHECLDRDVEAHTVLVDDVVARLVGLRADACSVWDQADYADAMVARDGAVAELRELVDRLGLSRECPKCGTGVGEPCENLTLRRRGEHVPTRAPHAERLAGIGSRDGMELAALRSRLAGSHGLVHDVYTALAGQEAIEKLIDLVRHLR